MPLHQVTIARRNRDYLRVGQNLREELGKRAIQLLQFDEQLLYLITLTLNLLHTVNRASVTVGNRQLCQRRLHRISAPTPVIKQSQWIDQLKRRGIQVDNEDRLMERDPFERRSPVVELASVSFEP